MGTSFYGVGAAQNVDKSGEILKIENLDDSKLSILTDEHAMSEQGSWAVLGAITAHKKIFSEKDCENPYQLKCWKETKVPFLYVEGELSDDEGHPNAQAAAALMKFAAKHPDYSLQPGLSIEGSILERGGSDNKVLEKTSAYGVALTIKPCNPIARLHLMHDLQKSDTVTPAPIEYIDKLSKSLGISRMKDLTKEPATLLKKKVDNLKKSLEDYVNGTTTNLKCYHCGKDRRFWKNSADIPHRCDNCGKAFTMASLFKAMNKE